LANLKNTIHDTFRTFTACRRDANPTPCLAGERSFGCLSHRTGFANVPVA